MTSSLPIAQQVKEHLADLNPLTVLGLPDLYESLGLIEASQRHAARAALYQVCAGTPVYQRQPPLRTYAVRVGADDLPGSDEHAFLSLPGIETSVLVDDYDPTVVEGVRAKLRDAYGPDVVKYWFSAVQRRSVDIAAGAMREARNVDRCILCASISDAPKSDRLMVCHIVSRRTRFWRALEDVHDTLAADGTELRPLLTDAGTRALIEKVATDPLHSSAAYMARMCKEHDAAVLAAIKTGIQKRVSGA